MVAVGINFNTCIGNTVVVRIGVHHVENAVVVVVGVSAVRRPVVVVVGVEEVGRTVTVEVTVHDGGKGGSALSTKGAETGGRSAWSVHPIGFPVHVVDATREVSVLVKGPRHSGIVHEIVGGAGCSGHDHGAVVGGIVGGCVVHVGGAVTVIVGVEIIGNAVPVHVTRPRELVDASVVVVVFVVATGP